MLGCAVHIVRDECNTVAGVRTMSKFESHNTTEEL